jgi:hypothetical protein
MAKKLNSVEIKFLAMEVLKRLNDKKKSIEQENTKKRVEAWEAQKETFKEVLKREFLFLDDKNVQFVLEGYFKTSFMATIETLTLPKVPQLPVLIQEMAYENLIKELSLETLVENFVNKYK